MQKKRERKLKKQEEKEERRRKRKERREKRRLMKEQRRKEKRRKLEEERAAAAAAAGAEASTPVEKRHALKVRSVTETSQKCQFKLVDSCTWPHCNPSCPKLKNPETGEFKNRLTRKFSLKGRLSRSTDDLLVNIKWKKYILTQKEADLN